MKDFTLHNPVEAVFGEQVFETLTKLCADRTVMLMFGRESAKQNGNYEQVRTAIDASATSCIDYSDISICTYDGIVSATAFARENGIDMVIGMGGAAVMDTAKGVAFCVLHDDIAAYLTHEKEQRNDEKLPLVLIPTYPSTGSEANGTSDIMGYPGSIRGIYADYALLFPPFTYSLDKEATAFSTLVLLSQTGYRYFNDTNPLSRAFTAASLRCVLDAYETLLEDPTDYDARGVMMLASFFETSGLLGLGMEGNWTYSIFSANALCRFTLDTSYREGLAIMLPRWLVWADSHHPEEVREFVIEVLGADPNVTPDEAMRYGFEKLLDISRLGGLPLSLDPYGPQPTGDEIAAAIAKVSSREFTDEEYAAMLEACYHTDYPELNTK